MKIKIDYLKEELRNGSYGPYTTYTIKSGNMWYSSYKKLWNSSWRQGEEVEAEVSTRTGKDGRTYYELKSHIEAPQATAPNNSLNQLKLFEDKADKIVSYLAEIKVAILLMKELLESKNGASELPPPPVDADIPPDQQEVDEKLPF